MVVLTINNTINNKKADVEALTTKKQATEILSELRKYSDILSEHYLTLEERKGESDNKLLLKVIKNVKKLIVRKCSKLKSLKDGEEWHDRIITALERDRKMW
jgi:hypothetical protein